MRTHRTRADQAHFLLQEWGAGYERAQGVGYPAAPMMTSVQGSKPEYTSPERYAKSLHRWATIDAAMRAVRRQRVKHYLTLYRCYVRGQMCSQTGVRRALEAFAEAYWHSKQRQCA